jgi:hypothetical protein
MAKFVKDFPALFIHEKKLLVVSDLHLGLEHELYEAGIRIPPQREKFVKTICHLTGLTGATTLIILGDVKHQVPGMSVREFKDVPHLLKLLTSQLRVILIKGNHDAFIERVIPSKVEVCPPHGLRLGRWGFFHGHAWPVRQLTRCDCLFMGHIHPVIQLEDRFGYRIIEPVWVKSQICPDMIKKRYRVKKTGKLELIIIPAFNHLLGGSPVNVKGGDRLRGPVLKNGFVDWDNAELYLLDGTYLGRISHLRLDKL